MKKSKKNNIKELSYRALFNAKLYMASTKNIYYISNRDGSFKPVNGTALSNGFFAYKHETSYFGWCITDIASGLSLVNKLKTLQECRSFIASFSEANKAKIDSFRTTPRYLEQCKLVADHIASLEKKD